MAQTESVKALMAALQAETAKLGEPKVQGGDLYFGVTKADSSLISAALDALPGSGALIVKSGGRYVFVGTHGRGVWSPGVDLNDAAERIGQPSIIAKLDNGEGWYGTIPGRADQLFHAGFEPIKDTSGVIGAYLVRGEQYRPTR
jgi:hypothetical protein